MKTQTSFARLIHRIIFSTALIGLACGAEAQSPVAVTAAGVRVIKESYGEKFGGLTAFNAQKGSSLALMLKSAKGAIIAVDTRESKLDSFTDDKGTNLLVKQKFGRGGIAGFPRISEDGKATIVEIEGGGIPAAGAGKLKAKGLLKVTVASEKKKLKSKAVKVGKGAAVKIGDYNFKITDTGKPDFGDEPLSIDFEIKQRIDEVAGFKFYKADGTEIKARSAGSSSGGFGNQWTVTKSFTLGEKVSSIIVEIEYWSQKKVLAVPFDVSAGVGG